MCKGPEVALSSEYSRVTKRSGMTGTQGMRRTREEMETSLITPEG